jgi:hypothetical protein
MRMTEELLEIKSSGSGLEKLTLMAVEVCGADHVELLYPQKLALKFADQWRLLSRYSSLADYKPRR